FTKEAYKEAVEKARDYIVAGDIFQVVPSQRWAQNFPQAPFALYRSLRSETYASWLLEQGLLRFSNSPSDATIVLGRGGIPLSADVFTALLDNDNTASWFIVPMAQHPQMYRYGYWNAEVDVREQLRC
ncbi:MAG: chorismate-binding protein, partial [bacterium]